MSEPIVTWYDELTQLEGIKDSTLLVTAAQRLSLAYEQAADVETALSAAGAELDAKTVQGLKNVVNSLLAYIKAEGECTRQLLLAEMRGGAEI